MRPQRGHSPKHLPSPPHVTTQETLACAHMLEHPYWPVGNEKKSPPTAPQVTWISD